MGKPDIVLEQYYEDVFRFLRGLSADEHLAEELTQETFYRALKAVDSYRGEADIRIWLCSIARNLYYTQYKKQKRFSTEEDMEEYQAEDKNFLDIIADREAALQVHRILHELQEPYKEVFSLRIFGELPFKDIGTLFGKSQHWACVVYHRAKEKIREQMEKENREEERRGSHEDGM
ncbi:MAG: sigma-70 family RNA polymerase sigma factor [bacterium]|nr:sigma-70 family RNA polymerase sigma factor [bacterium]MCM1374206.1 sigma-70 family RNA polymerase sigma factor [Muribaculum sp.]